MAVFRAMNSFRAGQLLVAAEALQFGVLLGTGALRVRWGGVLFLVLLTVAVLRGSRTAWVVSVAVNGVPLLAALVFVGSSLNAVAAVSTGLLIEAILLSPQMRGSLRSPQMRGSLRSPQPRFLSFRPQKP